ncbi:unnamed protein product [Gongylonema pulchrum]|uniref:Uncharacterized protein n=1 Tax=Gongylonema pulchrum TaxID=637853 RepID=A0A183ELU9_9BILA|nr:unnamed protein product [Gongylonema pulchrum]
MDQCQEVLGGDAADEQEISKSETASTDKEPSQQKVQVIRLLCLRNRYPSYLYKEEAMILFDRSHLALQL